MRKVLAWLLCWLFLVGPAARALETAAPAPSLGVGSSGQAVRQLQERLKELGLLPGKVDGLYGKDTAQAVRRLQQHLHDQGQDLRIDGLAGPETLRLVYDDLAVSALLDLKPGDKGVRVSRLQAALYDMRLLSDLPDGDYGAKTREAIERFQQVLVDNKVTGAAVSGIADHVTRQALQSDLSGLGLRLPQTFDDANPGDLTPDDLYAKAAIMLEVGSGRVFLDKQSRERIYPASTTKIMTLLLALEALQPDALITIPQAAGEVPKDSSLTPVTPGERMSVRDLLYGLMLRSGNDAANAVAVLVTGGVDNFVSRMNEKARLLGMSGTHFMNPHGYHDPEHYTTARDMALLALSALHQPAFREVIERNTWTMQPTEKRGELLIRVNADLFDPLSRFYYPGAFGIKSGYTRASGFCYVGCAQRDGRTLLAVVMGDRTRDQAWTDMGRLFDLGFSTK